MLYQDLINYSFILYVTSKLAPSAYLFPPEKRGQPPLILWRGIPPGNIFWARMNGSFDFSKVNTEVINRALNIQRYARASDAPPPPSCKLSWIFDGLIFHFCAEAAPYTKSVEDDTAEFHSTFSKSIYFATSDLI